MGIPPDDGYYEEGDECALCVDVIFDGKTPKYVQAVIEGIVSCNAIIYPNPPNGTCLMTQVAVCQWRGTIGLDTVVYNFGPGISNLVISREAFQIWFADSGAVCIDSFTNQTVCWIDGAIGIGGTAKVFWGPGIGKEPIT